jgi:hypothetical protein
MVVRTINRETPLNGRALPLNQYPIYLRDDLLLCLPDETEWRELLETQENSPERFWETLYLHGFDLVGFTRSYIAFSSQMNSITLKHIPEWLEVETLYRQEQGNDSYAVYRLTATSLPEGAERRSCSDLVSFVPAYRRTPAN